MHRLFQQKSPLIFGFELPIMSMAFNPNSSYVEAIQKRYNVQIMTRTRRALHESLILVKGVEWEVEYVKKATILLMEYLCENLAVILTYTCCYRSD